MRRPSGRPRSVRCADQPASDRAVGVVLVSLNPAYRADDLLYAINRSGCKALILAPTMRGSDYISILEEAIPALATAQPHELDASAAPELRSIFLIDNTPGDGSYETALARSPALVRFDSLLLPPSTELDARVDECTKAQRNDELAGIQVRLASSLASPCLPGAQARRLARLWEADPTQFSSGTTARAKAIGLTHRNVRDHATLRH